MRVSIAKINAPQSHSFIFSSERFPVYEIHFIGRAFICPGDGCAACGVVSKRLHGLGVSGTNRHVTFVEFGAPSIVRLDAIRREMDLQKIIGSRWTVNRPSNKRPLQVCFVGFEPSSTYEVISDQTLMRAISRLYSVPSPESSWCWDTYAERIKESLHRQIKKALLA